MAFPCMVYFPYSIIAKGPYLVGPFNKAGEVRGYYSKKNMHKDSKLINK
jgi:hypothetical protein